MRIAANKVCQAILVILLIQCSVILKAQSVKDEIFEKEELRLYKENTDTAKASMFIKRENCNSVVLSFFEEFNDTVLLFVNKRKQGQWFIHARNNYNESSGHSGVDHSLVLKKRRNLVVIKLVNQKKYVQFFIDKEYPLYSIQRYDNTWYINGRKYTMMLK